MLSKTVLLIQNKEMDVAITMSATVYQAVNGKGSFTNALQTFGVCSMVFQKGFSTLLP